MTARINLLWICSLCTLVTLVSNALMAADRPNVVLIMADDMGYECVTANGGQTYKTPRLDKMAKEGMRFEHCHSQPICTPTRVQIMTGRYNSRNYVRFGLLDPNEKTFGNLMKDAGYATAIVGKWQLSKANEEALDDPAHFGFDEYCLWQLSRRPGRYPNPGLEINGKEVDFTGGKYGPDIVSDFACDFMEKNKNKPFFLYYPMILPHWPFEPTPDGPDWDPTATGHSPSREAKYFREMVTYTDKMVGKLLDKIDALGLGEKTLVIFVGDNGTFTGITSKCNGRDWKGGKGSTRETGTRVPMIVRWTGKTPAGTVNGDLIDFSDMLPTIADATDTEVPAAYKVDGQSNLPQMLGEKGTPRESIYIWYFRHGKPVAPGGFGGGEYAQTQQYKLYKDGRFFDVKNDFLEESPLEETALSAEVIKIKKMLGEQIERYTRPGFYDNFNAKQATKENKKNKKNKGK